jgi:hypothetical protein
MPKYRALKDTTLPAGVLGPSLIVAGRVITVSPDEALLLSPEEWQLVAPPGPRGFGPQLDRMVAAPMEIKSAAADADDNPAAEEGTADGDHHAE